MQKTEKERGREIKAYRDVYGVPCKWHDASPTVNKDSKENIEPPLKVTEKACRKPVVYKHAFHVASGESNDEAIKMKMLNPINTPLRRNEEKLLFFDIFLSLLMTGMIVDVL